jgi:hypothetical protein
VKENSHTVFLVQQGTEKDCSCFDFAADAATLSTNGFVSIRLSNPVRPERTLSLSKGKSKGALLIIAVRYVCTSTSPLVRRSLS